MKELLHEMHRWMNDYMRSFRTDDPEVMRGIRLKEIHTGYVTTNARALAKYLGCNAHDTALAEIIGLFHDVGRFRQYAIYQTFNDAASEDHAELGLKVLAEEVDFLERLTPADADIVRFALIGEMYMNRDCRGDNRQSFPYHIRSMILQLQNHGGGDSP